MNKKGKKEEDKKGMLLALLKIILCDYSSCCKAIIAQIITSKYSYIRDHVFEFLLLSFVQNIPKIYKKK